MKCKVTEATAPADREIVQKIRHEVFVKGQGVPEFIEVDEFEDHSHHFLATINGVPAGAGRLRTKKSYAKFERIATLDQFRGQGVGRAVMSSMQDFAAQNYPEFLPAMHAQESAVSFYLQIGWVQVGEPFAEADIVHKTLIFVPQEKALLEKLKIRQDGDARDDIRGYIENLIKGGS